MIHAGMGTVVSSFLGKLELEETGLHIKAVHSGKNFFWRSKKHSPLSHDEVRGLSEPHPGTAWDDLREENGKMSVALRVPLPALSSRAILSHLVSEFRYLEEDGVWSSKALQSSLLASWDDVSVYHDVLTALFFIELGLFTWAVILLSDESAAESEEGYFDPTKIQWLDVILMGVAIISMFLEVLSTAC